MVRRNDRLFYHLTGTSFYKEVSAESLNRHRAIWDQELISENAAVYRSEYLSYQAMNESLRHGTDWDYAAYIDGQTERDYAAAYLKGVHNTDAAVIYQGLRKLREALGILQFSPALRVADNFSGIARTNPHKPNYCN